MIGVRLSTAGFLGMHRAALRSGLSLRAIAEITGLSYARIYQIEKEAEYHG